MHVFLPYYIKATFISPNHNSSVEQEKNTQQETNHSNQHSFFRQIVKKNLL